MSDDPSAETLARLALVIDDEACHRALAAWLSLQLPADTPDPEIVEQLRRVTDPIRWTTLASTVAKLRAADLLRDGRTTDVGLRWLQSVVSRSVATPKKGKR